MHSSTTPTSPNFAAPTPTLSLERRSIYIYIFRYKSDVLNQVQPAWSFGQDVLPFRRRSVGAE